MKNIIVILLVFLLVSCSAKKSYQAFKEENKKEIEISFGAPSFLVHAFIGDKEFKEFSNQISGIKKYSVLVSKENPTFLKSNFSHFIKNNGYEEIFRLNESNDKIHIYTLEKAEKLKEVIVQVENGKEIILLKVNGNLKLNDFEKLTTSTN